jgi:ribonuclease P protein subunit POP4
MSGNITDKNLIQHELIGLQASIIDTPCKTFENISGRIIDETMNTFKIEYSADNKLKTIIVPKNNTKFRFTLPADNNQDLKMVEINGTLLTKRPEDRIKKLAKIVQKANKKSTHDLSL